MGNAARAAFQQAATAQAAATQAAVQAATTQTSQGCDWNPFSGNSCEAQAVTAVAPAYANVTKCVVAMQCGEVFDYALNHPMQVLAVGGIVAACILTTVVCGAALGGALIGGAFYAGGHAGQSDWSWDGLAESAFIGEVTGLAGGGIARLGSALMAPSGVLASFEGDTLVSITPAAYSGLEKAVIGGTVFGAGGGVVALGNLGYLGAKELAGGKVTVDDVVCSTITSLIPSGSKPLTAAAAAAAGACGAAGR